MQDKDFSFLQNKINLIYKMLPMKEEGKDWTTLCSNTIIDLYGWQSENNIDVRNIIYKLKGILELNRQLENHEITEEKFFPVFRRTIFSCINKVKEMIK